MLLLWYDTVGETTTIFNIVWAVQRRVWIGRLCSWQGGLVMYSVLGNAVANFLLSKVTFDAIVFQVRASSSPTSLGMSLTTGAAHAVATGALDDLRSCRVLSDSECPSSPSHALFLTVLSSQCVASIGPFLSRSEFPFFGPYVSHMVLSLPDFIQLTSSYQGAGCFLSQ